MSDGVVRFRGCIVSFMVQPAFERPRGMRLQLPRTAGEGFLRREGLRAPAARPALLVGWGRGRPRGRIHAGGIAAQTRGSSRGTEARAADPRTTGHLNGGVGFSSPVEPRPGHAGSPFGFFCGITAPDCARHSPSLAASPGSLGTRFCVSETSARGLQDSRRPSLWNSIGFRSPSRIALPGSPGGVGPGVRPNCLILPSCGVQATDTGLDLRVPHK
jgi:hypothetical protein